MGEYCFCLRSSVNCDRVSNWFQNSIVKDATYPLTTGEGLLGGSIEIRAELGEGSDLTVLGQEELQGTSDLLHGLELGGGTDTRHGQTDVDSRADTLVEQLRLQEDLAVSDRNDVGGNVGGHITTLGLNDGQGGHGATTVLVVHLGGTLEQARVEVENVTGVGLTSGGTTQQQGHLTVGDGLLGQIVVNDQGVLAIVTEPFACRFSGQLMPITPKTPEIAKKKKEKKKKKKRLGFDVPMEAPVKGAMYCRGAASEAVAATTIEYFMASFSSRVLTSWATVDRFWPTAT
jgi:hypothetical protein